MTSSQIRQCFSGLLGLCLVVAIIGDADAQRRREFPPAYTPEPDARDLKSVLFNWTWHMGMLRGVDEHELAVTLEYQGAGTVSIAGEPCELSSYRTSNNYQYSGQRNQFACALPDGTNLTAIEVVSGAYAWDEDMLGAEMVAGEGAATARPDQHAARAIRLWADPQGSAKAALAGAGIGLLDMDRNLGVLLNDGSDRIGQTSVS
jgi:hypothetical protein